ncbi:MAG: family 16 glycoside hydrolase, partial [Planctomycetota bacterium]|nr:family 16 glycoside hydrolase [Planctomycetota bacterium]
LYRSGEKVLFSGRVSRDFVAEVTLDFHGERNARDGGLLFRATEPSIGYDAQKAYFAGLIPGTQLVILGKTDGTHWQELARSKTQIDPDQPQHLQLEVQGDQFAIFHNGKKTIEHSDSTHTQGRLGLRVVDTDTSFSKIVITPLALR